MLGSYGPSPSGEPYVKDFDKDDMPTGMLARSGTYNVRSRVTDDDNHVHLGQLSFAIGAIQVTNTICFRLGVGFQAIEGLVIAHFVTLLHSYVLYILSFLPTPLSSPVFLARAGR